MLRLFQTCNIVLNAFPITMKRGDARTKQQSWKNELGRVAQHHTTKINSEMNSILALVWPQYGLLFKLANWITEVGKSCLIYACRPGLCCHSGAADHLSLPTSTDNAAQSLGHKSFLSKVPRNLKILKRTNSCLKAVFKPSNFAKITLIRAKALHENKAISKIERFS